MHDQWILSSSQPNLTAPDLIGSANPAEHSAGTICRKPGLLLDEDEFRIDGAMLGHGIPCLAFALTEKLRVNVWREGLRQLELPRRAVAARGQTCGAAGRTG
jgi:hypothetical protein